MQAGKYFKSLSETTEAEFFSFLQNCLHLAPTNFKLLQHLRSVENQQQQDEKGSTQPHGVGESNFAQAGICTDPLAEGKAKRAT